MTQAIDHEKIVNRPKDLLRLMRPSHWTKNAFVFTGFVFGSDYTNLSLFLMVVLVAIAFCFISSGIYIMNDIVDCERDRNHPTKMKRPLASGKVTKRAATILLTILGVTGLSIGFWVSNMVGFILLLYIVMNILYSYKLKEVVVVDVFCISFGFMLRIFSGTLGVGIPPSKWLLFCGMMLTLFLGFAKRRAEMISNPTDGGEQRKVLDNYGAVFLDELITICATGAIISYCLYTMSDQTMLIQHTHRLIYTVPFVIFAIFRYLYLLNNHNMGEDPTHDLIKDPHIAASVLGWTLATLYILNVT